MATIQYVVSATDAASAVFARIAASADGLDRQLADLSKRIATPEVDLKDAKFQLGMLNAAKRLDKLSAMIADPSVDVDTAKAQTEILRITAMLDRLDAKRVNVKVDVDRSMLSRLGGLLGAGGGAGGAAGIAGGALGIGAAIGPLLVGLSQVASALAAAGAGVAAFGALSIPQFSAVSGALSQIKTDMDAYERATTAASKSLALKHIRQDWADLTGPQRQAVHGIQSLQTEFGKLSAKLAPITFKVLNDGLKIAGKLLPDLLPFARAAGNAIDGLLKSFGKFAQTAGFKAFLAQLQALSGPAITALGLGLGKIAVSVGKLILVSASPNSIKVLSGLLTVMAGTIDVITFVIGRASGKMVEWKNDFGDIGRVVGGFLKNLANWQVDVALWVVNATRDFRNWAHDVAHTFDTLRHSVAVTWNAMWAATIGAQIHALGTIVGWFRGLPGRILGSLRGLGHTLGSFASAALTEFWNGFKNVAGNILHWLGGFLSSLVGIAKKILGVFSPSSVFFDIGKNLMLGLEGGIKAHAHKAVNAAKAAAQAAAGGGAHGGPTSASAAQAQAYARSRLSAFGWGASQMASLIALWNGESGWNRLARNPTSGAYGIPQALPPGKMGAAANPPTSSAAAQINWGMGYIRSVYGDPANAFRLWLSRSPHWYGGGLSGGLFTRPTLIGVGERGPERVDVTPAGSQAARSVPLVNVEQMVVQDATDMALVVSRLNFAIYAASLGS